MNSITVPVSQSIKIGDLTAEQFKMVEKASLFDDLKEQYKRLKLNLKFDINSEIGHWLDNVSSVHTRRMYFTAINHFLRFCGNEVLDVTAKEADKYILFLKEDKCSGSTVKLYVGAVSAFYSHLQRYDHVSKNPFHKSKVKINAVPKDKYIPTAAEIEALDMYILVNYSSETYTRLHMAITLMKDYGVRIGFLNGVKLQGNTLVSMSKGKEHKIFLQTREEIAYYNQYKDILESLNSNTVSKYFNDSVKVLHKQGKLGGIFSPHCLRHYFAVNYYKNYGGQKLLELRNLLGHSSIATTERYLRSLNLDLS